MKKAADDSTTIHSKKGWGAFAMVCYDGNKKIIGIKIHTAIPNKLCRIYGYPQTIFNSTKVVKTLDRILDLIIRDSVKQFKYCFADQVYNNAMILQELKKET